MINQGRSNVLKGAEPLKERLKRGYQFRRSEGEYWRIYGRIVSIESVMDRE